MHSRAVIRAFYDVFYMQLCCEYSNVISEF